MIILELESPQPPPVVLAALRAHAGEWRESEIPPDLARGGILAVECRMKADGCVVTYDKPHLQVEATVRASSGGSRVRVRVGYTFPRYVLYLGSFPFVVFALVGVLSMGARALLVLLLPLAGFALQQVWLYTLNRTLSLPLDAAGAYLVQRVTDAVAGASTATQPPSAPEKRATSGRSPARPTPLITSGRLAVAGYVFVLLLATMLFLDDKTEYTARRAIQESAAHATAVVIDGARVSNDTALLALFQELRHVGAHHSSPQQPVMHVLIMTARDTMSVILARDSERPHEFWVFRAGPNWNNDPLGQDAGRIESARLDSLLAARGL
jgi:hypothetical protein